MGLQLIIDGKLAEVSPSTPIALTFVANDLAELQNRQSNHSNRFKLPKTRRNREILELAEEINSETLIPYRRRDAVVIQDGVQIIPDGTFELLKSGSEYEGVILSGNAGFFDLIKDKNLTDLDLSEFSHVFDIQAIADSRFNDSSDGFIYPVINYGNLDASNVFDVRFQFLAMFAKALVDKIMEETGFTLSGNIITRLISPPGTNDAVSVNIWENLILPFTNDALLTTDLFRGGLSSDINVVTPSIPFEIIHGIVVPFDVDLSSNLVDNEVTLDPITSEFVIDIDQSPSRNFILDLLVKTTVFDNVIIGVRIIKNRIDIFQPGTILVQQIFVLNIIEDEKLLQINTGFINLVAGDRITATINVINGDIGGPPVPVTSGFSIKQSGTFFFFEEKVVNPSENVPDMTQKDFMKGVLQVFGITPQARSIDKTIQFIQIKDIYDNQDRALDWSDKIAVTKSIGIGYTIGNYAQVNKLRYKEDTLDENFGSGDILIDDETIDGETIIVELPFAPTLDSENIILGVTKIPEILKLDSNNDLSISTKPRILFMRRGQGTENLPNQPDDILYSDGTKTILVSGSSIPLCSFDMDEPTLMSLGFDKNTGLIESHYAKYRDSMFVRAKTATHNFNLDQVDISSIDHSIPIYLSQFNEYFYLNMVKQYIGGRLTAVELIRL